MQQKCSRSLPDGYRQVWSFDLTRTRDLLRLNLAGLILFVVSLVGFGVLAHAAQPDHFNWRLLSGRLTLVELLILLGELLAVTVAMIILHEGLHGLFFWIFTGSRPRFSLKIYYASAAAPDWYIPRAPYLLISLAPLLGITLLGIFGFYFFSTTLLLPLYLLLVLNTSGAIGDLWVFCKLLVSPKDVLVNDHGDSITYFSKTELSL